MPDGPPGGIQDCNGQIDTREEWLDFRTQADAWYETVSDEWIDQWNDYCMLSAYGSLDGDERPLCLLRDEHGYGALCASGNPAQYVKALSRKEGRTYEIVRQWDVPHAKDWKSHLWYRLFRIGDAEVRLTDELIAEADKTVARWLGAVAMFAR